MEKFTAWCLRWVPDAWVFVLVITLIVFVLAWIVTNHGPVALVQDYVKGFWALLTFAMQMSILMITGFAIADSKPANKVIKSIVDLPKTALGTLIVFTLVCGFLNWLHWGIGLMSAIMMGREIAVRKKGLGIHYVMLPAIAYGSLICANGPSQAAQLLIATPGNFIEKVIGGTIPLSETTFNSHLMTGNVLLLLGLVGFFVLMRPKSGNVKEISPELAAEFAVPELKAPPRSEMSPAERWNRSLILQLIIAAIGLYAVGYHFFIKKGGLDLNTLNFTFLFVGIALHGNPKSFINSVQRGTSTVYGVIIQFPMYAGIFGIISYSGLAAVVCEWFVAISSQRTFPWIVYLYTCILDMFVPSAGSKFVIEAPYIVPAAKELGSSIPHVVNAYTWGSLTSNLLQPFWALPVLAGFRVQFQDILPYTAILWIFHFAFVSFFLLVWPAGF